MRERKNILLLFSKVPAPGKVKTRLTPLKDGVFDPEVASTLYHCMLFDVAEICCAALAELESIRDADPTNSTKFLHAHSKTNAEACERVHDTYELVISTTPSSNKEVMRALFENAGTWPREIIYIADEGTSFDEHYNDAFDQAWERGASCILSFGADMPALTVADIVRGFKALHQLDETPGGGMVLAPDQEMGVSVVGWTRETSLDHTGVFYNKDGLTVLPAYIQKARAKNLPAYYLPPVPDVDTMADLYHNITLVEALNYCARFDGNTPPWRTAQALKEMGWDNVFVPANDLFDPRDEIDTKRSDAT